MLDAAGEGRQLVEFSAEADCVPMPDNRYRIVDLRVGKLGRRRQFLSRPERFLQCYGCRSNRSR